MIWEQTSKIRQRALGINSNLAEVESALRQVPPVSSLEQAARNKAVNKIYEIKQDIKLILASLERIDAGEGV